MPPDDFEHPLRTPPMTLSASFPMYDFEEVCGAHEVLWNRIARKLERAGVAEDSPATELLDLRNAVCVVNSHQSHSGANALRAPVAPLNRGGRFFSRIVTSGSHPASVAAVARGEADLAAIDCVTYAHLERYRPSRLEGTRGLCYTAHAPGIPFVTRAGSGPDRIRQLQTALLEAFEEPEVRAAGAAVFIDGVEILPLSAYDRIFEFQRLAIAQGYPELR